MEDTASIESDREEDPGSLEYPGGGSSAPRNAPESQPIANLHDALGMGDSLRRIPWPSTIQALAECGYEMGDEVGHGGFASVRRAVERATGRVVAVKIIVDPRGESHLDQFERECKVLASPSLPEGLAPRYFFSRSDPGIQPFIVMELINGIKIHTFVNGPPALDLASRVALIERVLRQLLRLHEANLLFVDLSPSNILIVDDGAVRFVDFGPACRRDPGYMSGRLDDGKIGTPGFEWNPRDRGDRPDHYRDLHAAACVAFLVLTGSKPGQVASLDGPGAEPLLACALANARVPGEVQRIILKGLRSKADGDLYHSAAAFADDLKRWRGSHGRFATRLVCVATLLVLFVTALWVGPYLFSPVETRRSQEHGVIADANGGPSSTVQTSNTGDARGRRPFVSLVRTLTLVRDNQVDTRFTENARAGFRYITLDTLHNRTDVTEFELDAAHRVLEQVLETLAGRPVKLEYLDREQTLARIDVTDFGEAFERAWNNLLVLYPYGLNFEASDDPEVRKIAGELRVLESPAVRPFAYLRADWLIVVAVDPASEVSIDWETVAKRYAAPLDLHAMLAELGFRIDGNTPHPMKGRLKKLVDQDRPADGPISRGRWAGDAAVAGLYHQAARELGLGAASEASQAPR